MGRIVKDYLELKLPRLIERDISIELPKIDRAVAIIGPRRAGKTYYMFQIIKFLLRNVRKEETVYINLEDFRLESIKLKDMELLLEVFYEIFPENARKSCYFFLDEVQNLNGWERFVRYLIDRRQRVFITGSSSKLLSKELATVLRGRSITVNVFPFSFKELLKARSLEVSKYLSTYEEAVLKKALEGYLRWGGYPESVLYPEKRDDILREILDVTIFRDVVERYSIRNLKALRLTILGAARSAYLTVSRLYNNLKGLGIEVGKTVLANYIEYLNDCLVMFPLRAFAKSYKKIEKYPFKPYLVDNGLLTILGVESESKLLENLVFTELLKRGFEPNRSLYYYRVERNGEVDFLLRGISGIEGLVQVTRELNEENYDREIKSLVSAGKELGCKNLLVLTKDQEEKIKEAGFEVKVAPIWKWLLER